MDLEEAAQPVFREQELAGERAARQTALSTTGIALTSGTIGSTIGCGATTVDSTMLASGECMAGSSGWISIPSICDGTTSGADGLSMGNSAIGSASITD